MTRGEAEDVIYRAYLEQYSYDGNAAKKKAVEILSHFNGKPMQFILPDMREVVFGYQPNHQMMNPKDKYDVIIKDNHSCHYNLRLDKVTREPHNKLLLLTQTSKQ